jgi:hypothetical protein
MQQLAHAGKIAQGIFIARRASAGAARHSYQ